MQLLNATGFIESCAVSVWPSDGQPSQSDKMCGDEIDRISSTEYSHIRTKVSSVIFIQLLNAVQCNLLCLNGSSNVQITNRADSVSGSEHLPLVRDVITKVKCPLVKHWDSVLSLRPTGCVQMQFYTFRATALEVFGWAGTSTSRSLKPRKILVPNV